jgi:oligosaccharide repeat unit polymerase
VKVLLGKHGDRISEENIFAIPIGRRMALFHPAVVFSAVWLGVTFLYSLHLSKILQYSSAEAIEIAAYLWAPFLAVTLIYALFHHVVALAYSGRAVVERIPDINLLESRLTIWFRVWLFMSLVEIVVSGGVPIVWLITHNSKTYLDFGITSLHGLVNSLLLSVAISRFALFLITGKKKHLLVPTFAVAWFVIAITRNLMIVALLEFAMVFLQMRPIRKATLLKFVAGFLCLVFAFGVIGDFRQGSSDAIRFLAQPTDQYPEWLPSGILWAYIYITTPINNLIYTMHTTHPVDSLLFPNTVSTLFPTVIRLVIYGNQLGDAESGQLVDSAFNVSTAYIGPYQDYGLVGIALMSTFAAMLCGFFWYRRNLQSILMFAVVTQCLILTLFFNHFFTLPIISQLLWLTYFFLPKLRLGKATRGVVLAKPDIELPEHFGG